MSFLRTIWGRLAVAARSIYARYIIGLILIYWLVRTDVLDFAPLFSIAPTILFEGIALGISITSISTLRVQYLLADQGITVRYYRCFIYSSIGLFYSLFLPGGISGDAARAYYFFKDVPQKRTAVLGALLLDRFIGMITLIGLGLLSGLFLVSVLKSVIPYLVGFSFLLIALIVGLVVAVRYEIQHRETPGAHRMLLLWEKIRGTFVRLNLTNYSTRALATSIALSVLMNLLTIILIYICSVLNQSHLGFMEVSAVSPLGLMTNAIPLSPGGLGVGEKSFDMLYKAVGGENGAGAFLMTRIFLYCPSIFGGVFAAFYLFKLHQSPFARGTKL